MERTQRISADFTISEMFNSIKRWRYEVVDVFGCPLKIPKRNAEAFKREIASLEILLPLFNYKVETRGNHTILEVLISGKDNSYYLDFHVQHKSPVVNDMLPLRKKSKLKRIVISKIGINQYETICRTSDGFHYIIKEMQGLI